MTVWVREKGDGEGGGARWKGQCIPLSHALDEDPFALPSPLLAQA